jgi:hypothetical protein
MRKTEILAELPKLSAQERGEILEQLCLIEEAAGPTAKEMAMLDEAQTAYDANPSAGTAWSEVQARLRQRK